MRLGPLPQLDCIACVACRRDPCVERRCWNVLTQHVVAKRCSRGRECGLQVGASDVARGTSSSRGTRAFSNSRSGRKITSATSEKALAAGFRVCQEGDLTGRDGSYTSRTKIIPGQLSQSSNDPGSGSKLRRQQSDKATFSRQGTPHGCIRHCTGRHDQPSGPEAVHQMLGRYRRRRAAAAFLRML